MRLQTLVQHNAEYCGNCGRRRADKRRGKVACGQRPAGGFRRRELPLYTEMDSTSVDTNIIVDDDHGEYLLMRVGWRGETRVRHPVFYLRLRNGKIWIEEDWTKVGVVTELMVRGVSNEDIVLAFNPPELRELTEFAIA